MSAAFDSIDQHHKLQVEFVVSGSALTWLQSYPTMQTSNNECFEELACTVFNLTDCYQCVNIDIIGEMPSKL